MAQYCLDTDVFIQAKNGPYGFDIVPSFWGFLDSQFQAERIFSTLVVYDELRSGNDDLAKWVLDRREFFIPPNEDVQRIFSDIADYVNVTYPTYSAQPFLGCADPWVIAHAKHEDAIVVTNEKLVPGTSSKVKIPNICKQFGVPWVDTYKMLRDLSANI